MAKLMTVKEYAIKEEITVQAVYNRIAKNLVKFQKVGKTFLIIE